MTYTCNKFDYTPASTPMLKQGVKYGRRPKNAVAGSNGSFIISNPAKLILHLKNDEGGTMSRDIAGVARGVAASLGKKLLATTAKKIGSAFVGKSFDVSEDGYINGLDSQIRSVI